MNFSLIYKYFLLFIFIILIISGFLFLNKKSKERSNLPIYYAHTFDVHILDPKEEAELEGRDFDALDEFDKLYRENQKEIGNRNWEKEHVS